MRKNFPPNTTCPAGPSPHFGKAPRLFFIRSGIPIPGMILILTFFLLTGAHLQAATITSAATGNWSAGATWVGGVAPVAGDDVIIASGHTVTLTAAVNITTGNLTVTGTLALAGFNLTAGSLSGAGNIGSASGTPTVTVGSNNSSTTYSGVFSGANAQLTKQGTGTLTLTGANTYTGATTISAGTLSIGDGGTTGSVAGASIVNNAALIFNRSNALTYSGVISGSGTLTKAGTGTLTLSGANTYAGATTINAGSVIISNDNGLGTPPVSATPGHLVFNGGTLETNTGYTLNANRGVLLNAGGGTFKSSSQNIIYQGIIDGTGNLTVTGCPLFLNGASPNTYTGVTTVDGGGSVIINADNKLGAVPGSATPGSIVLNNGRLRFSANFTLHANRGITLGAGGGTFEGGASITYQGIIAGSGNLTISSTMNLTLSGASANTYTGTTSVISAALSISQDNKLGAAPGSPTPGALILEGGTFSASSSFTLNANRGINIVSPGNATIGAAAGATLTYGGIIAGNGSLVASSASTGTVVLTGANTYTGITQVVFGALSIGNGGTTGSIPSTSIGLLDATAQLVFNRSDNITYSAVISGSGSVTKQGAGTLTLTNANTYTGATTISAGTLQLGTASERISNSSALTVNAGATFDLNGFSESVASLAGAGTVTSNVAGAVTVAHVGNTNTTFSGVIQNGSGTVALTKAGTGTLTLTGANTYTGNTSISAGTLSIGNGTTAGSIASASINNNGTLTFNLPAGTYANTAVISGAGGVTKSGAGTLTLSGANSYAGTTSITAGTLIAGSATALGTGSLVSVSSGATLRTDFGLNLGALSIAGVMNCNGNNSTCENLVLGTTIQTSNGTYGSTASGATNQDNTRFTPGSTGLVTLTTSPMTITVTTTAARPTVTLPLNGTANVRVFWGDGNDNTYTSAGNRNYTYATPGNYTIIIYGALTQFGALGGYPHADRITGVTSWGSTGLRSLTGAFQGSTTNDNATNLVQVPGNLPSSVTNLSNMFTRASAFNQNISSWNTANVVNMEFMFSEAASFNQPIGNWNTSNVTTMRSMFQGDSTFNQDIGAWDLSNVNNIQGMFRRATVFNNGGSASINNWNTSNVLRMLNVFSSATSFNQPIGNWNNRPVAQMISMFEHATSFNQDISARHIRNEATMS
ncbi:MAG TPA: hypothetical protein DCF33_10615, partial [Saprospirales bacterium]|nr:hypothetical protein [Saprospirales bacterium]